MIKKIILINLSFLCFLFSQSEINRDTWIDLNEENKLLLVKGYYLGLKRSLIIINQESNKMKRQDKFWSRSFSEEQTVKRLNEFFSDSIPTINEITLMIDNIYSNADNSLIDFEMVLRIIILHYNGNQLMANKMILDHQRKLLQGK
mgnify:CR=1 FL=1|tara:strand:+ start:5838 stop:6275 length:438 start_codon:yes stop_codon:yes gene_type:complete